MSEEREFMDKPNLRKHVRELLGLGDAWTNTHRVVYERIGDLLSENAALRERAEQAEKPRMLGTKLQVDLLKCPRHGTLALGIQDTRITELKCCGQWDTVKTWPIRPDSIGSLARRDDSWDALRKLALHALRSHNPLKGDFCHCTVCEQARLTIPLYPRRHHESWWVYDPRHDSDTGPYATVDEAWDWITALVPA